MDMPRKAGFGFATKVLIIDNYDSFTYNLYQLVGEILQDSGKPFVLDVKRNDEISANQIKQAKYGRIIISPGPGNPADASYFGVCPEVLLDIGRTTPVLGVCLGMQGLAHYYGGKVVKAKLPMHGKTSQIRHSGSGLFRGIPQKFNAMRYHSLVVSKANLPDTFEVTARTAGDQGEIMGLRHKTLPLAGVQFHPESYATEYGKQLLQNFLSEQPVDFSVPLTFGQAYDFQSRVLKNEVATGELLKVFELLDKRELADEEFLGFYQASTEAMQTLPVFGGDLLDTCGTGGDGKQTFNISTLAAVVCASLGVKVAKHGNRAASSRSGSADLLEALGVNIQLSPGQAKACLERCGLTFMFAPLYHPAFRYAKDARREFGKKTYFNLLGPLLNPADAGYRFIGVADPAKIPLILSVLKTTNIKKAVVVHSRDGLDELSPAAPSELFEFQRGGGVSRFILNPKTLGFKYQSIAGLEIKDSEEAKTIFMDLLSGNGSQVQVSATVLNSAGALVAANVVENLAQGVKQAYSAITSGKALAKFEEFRRVSNEVAALTL